MNVTSVFGKNITAFNNMESFENIEKKFHKHAKAPFEVRNASGDVMKIKARGSINQNVKEAYFIPDLASMMSMTFILFKL